MKKLLSFLVFSSLVLGSVMVLPSSADTAAVTGKVQLNAKSSGFPSELVDIFIGHDDDLPTGKKGKKIDVEATYTGETTLRLSEVGDFEDSEKRYLFDIPIPTVMQTFTKKKAKAVKKSGLFRLIFDSLTSLNGSDDDNDDDDDSNDDFDSNSLVKAFSVSAGNMKRLKKKIKASASSSGQTLSISKLIAMRKGNKGTIKGIFASSNKKAKGRFALKFTYGD